MTTRKEWVSRGTYDNQGNQRRETYDDRGNVIESSGILWIKNNRKIRFGFFPDIPEKPKMNK